MRFLHLCAFCSLAETLPEEPCDHVRARYPTLNYPFTPFLPATVFLRPLRVRALQRVRWPRVGNPLRCRSPL